MDDEELALDVLEHYISRLEGFEVAKRCCDVFEANRFLEESPVDLIFLDIQMPKLNGMDWIKRLENKPCVVFCTAFEQFALESYEVDAVDYLLKPFSFERFEKAALKAKQRIEVKYLQKKSDKQYLTIHSERMIHKVSMDDILYIQGLSNYYIVVTKDKRFIAYGSLAALEKRLPSESFLRIHKSYIVSTGQVKAVSGNMVVVGQVELPVGRKYKAIVEKSFLFA